MHITLNFALSADGKITTRARQSATFTSQDDLQRLIDIRRDADAILVGRGTLEADNMRLIIPDRVSREKQPLRCLISRKGQFDPEHKVFHSEGGSIHLLATEANAEFRPVKYPRATLHRTSLDDFLHALEKNHGVQNLLCEGGGEVAKSLFALDLVDQIHLTLATHSLFGGRDAPTLTGVPGDFLPASRHYRLHAHDIRDSGEVFLTYLKNSASQHVR